MRPVQLPRSRRAFSLLEVAAAAVVFAIVALGVSLTVGRALANRASAAIQYELVGKMDAALAEMSHTDFATLLAGTFTPPSSCPGEAFLGTEGVSCFDAANRTIRGTWALGFGSDVVMNATSAASYVDISLTSQLPDGSSVVRSRRVLAPTPGFTGDAILRVQVAGASNFNGSLFLLDADTPTDVIAVAELKSSHVALFRVEASQCTAADPCRLGLSAGVAWSTNGSFAVSPVSSFSPDALIVLEQASISQLGLELFVPSKIRFELLAEGDDEVRASARVPSSICLWASFNDGIAERLTPACNTAAGGTLMFESYAFDPQNPSFQAPIPPRTPIRFYADRPNGSCPDLGQVGASAGNWEQAAVCTTWTWGVPKWIEQGDDQKSFSSELTFLPGTSSVAAVWSGSLASPAAGYGTDPLWENPREYGACAADASCMPSFTVAPESSVCPSSFCLSARVPSLLAPRSGSVFSKVVNSTSTEVVLTVDDPGGDPVSVELVSAPQSGTLQIDGSVLAPGDSIGTSDGDGPGSFELTFTEGTQIDMVWFTVRLANLVPGGTKEFDIALYRNNRIWSFDEPSVTLNQNGSANVSFASRSVSGGVLGSVPLTVSLPTGLSATPASPTTDSTGRVSFVLSAGALSAGSYSMTLTAPGGRSVEVPIQLRQAPGSMAVSAADLDQGSSSAVSLTVQDATGAPLAGYPVSFSTLTSGSTRFALGVRPDPAGCTTDASGECALQLVADPSAAAGSYTLTATAGSVVASDGFSVAAVVSGVQAPALDVPQGTSTSWTVSAVDGSGTPMPNIRITHLVVPAGVSVTPSSVLTGASGTATFTVTVPASTAAGVYTVPFSTGSNTSNVQLRVSSSPASLQPGPQVVVPVGDTATGYIDVFDAAGAGVQGVQLSFSAQTGFQFASLGADASGRVMFTVSASSSVSTALRQVQFTVVSPVLPSPPTGTIDVQPVAPPASVSFSGAVVRSGRAELTIGVWDKDGAPVPDAVVSLSGLPDTLLVSPRSVAGADGLAPLLVADSGSTQLGSYQAKVTVSHLSSVRFFTVVVPVVSGTTGVFAPAAVPSVLVSGTSASGISVSWSPPVDDGGSSVLSYRVYLDGSLHAISTLTTQQISGLAPSTSYAVQVAACSAIGCSPVSAEVSSSTYPSAPSGVQVAAVSAGAEISWTLPSGTLSSLSVQYKLASSATWISVPLTTSSTSYTLRSVSAGSTYDFRVSVSNSAGTSVSGTVSESL